MKVRHLAIVAMWSVMVSPALAGPPEAAEILKSARAAAKTIQSVRYQAKLYTEGNLARHLRSRKGEVTLVRTDGPLAKVRIESAGDELGLQLVCDGAVACLTDHEKREFVRKEGEQARKLMVSRGLLIIWDLISEESYEKEIASGNATYEGIQVVDGLECDVVSVNPSGDKVEVRWYFSTTDFLPRRVERILSSELGGGGKLTFTLGSLELNPVVADSMFQAERPEGYSRLYLEGELKPIDPDKISPRPRKRGEARPPKVRRGALLEVDTLAPDWVLKTPEGKSVTLREHRGKVVVLSFWNTWRRECDAAMPSVQKLYEHYKTKPVVVYGINILEPDDPVKFMEVGGYTYSLLLNGDKVAYDYHVPNAPVLYVIGPEGKILHAQIGPGKQMKVKQVMDNALKKMEK